MTEALYRILTTSSSEKSSRTWRRKQSQHAGPSRAGTAMHPTHLLSGHELFENRIVDGVGLVLGGVLEGKVHVCVVVQSMSNGKPDACPEQAAPTGTSLRVARG